MGGMRSSSPVENFLVGLDRLSEIRVEADLGQWPEHGLDVAFARKQRLLELESEQRLEDAKALKFTEAQRLSLFHSFRSVKFEWSDLDGMRSVRRRYNSSCPASPPPLPRSPAVQPHICVPRISISPPHLHQVQAQPVSVSPTSTPAAFAVLTNAHLASFGKDDTIRGHSHTLVAFPGSPQKDGEGGEGGDEDEDAWVDDEEDDNATFIAGEEDEDDGLATPVPRAWGLPPTYDEEEPATPIPEVYEREATPTPYDYPRAYGGLQERGEREGEQVGGKRKR
ncbi:hypothetical protein B0H19DRAFT_1224695 [Mycena capillaripes]|nr:hypothetical protein B0H19DRAFT_1224695 [Mycena capillaripes]